MDKRVWIIFVVLLVFAAIQVLFTSSSSPETSVVVDDKIIAYKVIGNGSTPLIAIHGSPGGKENYDSFAGLLPNHTIYALDMLGFGESSMWTSDYGYAQAKFVAGFMDELNISQAEVIGYSWGGLVATKFAHDYPNRTTKLYLLAGVSVPEGSHTRSHSVETARYIITAPLLLVYPGAFSSIEFSLGQRHGFLRSFLDADQRAMYILLADLTVPVRFIHGTEDTVVLPKASEIGMTLVEDGDFVYYLGGHGKIFNDAEPIVEAMFS
jgi:pimeloyl-ACP methyl ester carboxylesterase